MNRDVFTLYRRKDGEERMDPKILEEYAGRVYAYAVKRTFSMIEAEELSQEILLSAVCDLPKLRDESRFEPWLWGLAANVTRAFRRRMGRERSLYVLDLPEDIAAPEDGEDSEELYAALRERIARLSREYRELLILRYYDGLSVKSIAARLSLPEGTVTWRLSEARRKLKKELENMEETALRPKDMRIEFYGTWDGDAAGRPPVFIGDALSKNILIECYEVPRSAEELSRITGVPAYYIEDRIANLLARNALTETGRGKNATAFPILTDKTRLWFREHAARAMEPMADRFADAMDKITSAANRLDFYRGDRSDTSLCYLFWFLASEVVRERWNPLPSPDAPIMYDGQRWGYIGIRGNTDVLRIRSNRCLNDRMGKGRFRHEAYGGIGNVPLAPMMWYEWINACEDIFLSGGSDDAESVSACAARGYALRNADGTFRLTLPVFTLEQKADFDELCRGCLSPLMDETVSRALTVAEGYRALFPDRLAESAKVPVYWTFRDLFAVPMDCAVKSGRLPPYPAGVPCDVLIQFRK